MPRTDQWLQIGAAMVGPQLIGQPARVQHRSGQTGNSGEITGISIERNAYPSVSIDGARCSLDEWDVFVNVPPDLAAETPGAASPSSPRERASIRFTPRIDETPLEGIARHIGETAGAVSVCWEHIDRAGIFDSRTAGELTEELTSHIINTLREHGAR